MLYCVIGWLRGLCTQIVSRSSCFVRDFRLGLESGYPLCCVTEYSVERLLRGTNYVANRGILQKGQLLMDFVPCHLHLLFCDHVEDTDAAMRKGLGFPKGALPALFPNNPKLCRKIEEILTRKGP